MTDNEMNDWYWRNSMKIVIYTMMLDQIEYEQTILNISKHLWMNGFKETRSDEQWNKKPYLSVFVFRSEVRF